MFYLRRKLKTRPPAGASSTHIGDEEPKHQQQQQPLRRPVVVVPLYDGLGTYHAELWCGSPPQVRTVIVDTGSSTTAFACTECSPSRCGRLDRYHSHPHFLEAKSSTFQKLSCTSDCNLGECDPTTNECVIDIWYEENSGWKAFEAFDTCFLGGFHAKTTKTNVAPVGVDDDGNLSGSMDPHTEPADSSFQLRFGCQTKLMGKFRTQRADGIMGMDIGRNSLWNQMFLQETVPSRSFSLCFRQRSDTNRFGTEAGAMTVGGTDERLHSTQMVYSAINPDIDSMFSVQLHKIYLRRGGGGDDNSVLSSDTANFATLQMDQSYMKQKIVIIDSGSTDSFFVRDLGGPFRHAWQTMVGKPYTNDPISLTDEELNNLPTIIFQFKGHSSNKEITETGKTIHLAKDIDLKNPSDVLFAVPPSSYMTYQHGKGVYVPSLYFDESEECILGANLMVQHDVFFDAEHYRMGWAESSCDHAQSIASFFNQKKSADVVTPSEPYKEPDLLFRLPDTARVTTPAVFNVSFSGVLYTWLCTSAPCRISVTGSGFLVALAAVVLLLLQAKHQPWIQRHISFTKRAKLHQFRKIRSCSMETLHDSFLTIIEEESEEECEDEDYNFTSYLAGPKDKAQ